jgi:hypothetical protein
MGGFRDSGSAASILQQGGRSFTGPFGLGRARRGLVCSRCFVWSMNTSRRGGAVEVDSSGVAARLLFQTLTMSCTSAGQAAC